MQFVTSLSSHLMQGLVVLALLQLPSSPASAQEVAPAGASQIATAESPNSGAGKKIKIGVLSGLTGAAAKWNRFQNMGITLAQEELAKAGFPIEIVVEDSQTQPARAIAAYHKLFEFDRIDALLADDFGLVVAPLLPVARQERRFLVAISLPHDRYCQEAQGYFYSMTSQFSQSRDAFDQFFRLNPHLRRIALVVFDDPEWGNSYRAIWTDLAKAHGVVIVETFLNNEWSPDFKTALARILAKKPDAIFLAHEPESFLKARTQLGYTGPIISANNLLEVLADNPNRRENLEGVYVVDPEISADFRSRFTARFGREPILEAYAGYESLMAMAKAFQANPHAPQEAMKSISYQGIAGRVDFTGASCAGNYARWGLFQFKNGKMVRVEE